MASGEASLIGNELNNGFITAAMIDNSNEESPRAYLNYILLDQNFNYVTSGFDRLTKDAEVSGDGTGSHQRLSLDELIIPEDGYLLVFLSNESKNPVEVYFDDFSIEHHYNAIIQADDYYPFGLTFNEYKNVYSTENTYLYQGKERLEFTQYRTETDTLVDYQENFDNEEWQATWQASVNTQSLIASNGA
ncbi:MAG: glycoside hydrolase family 92 protein, partial [Cyclobacteriaceae bacterium]|nr:glycoside hydrolase family 92 protein [Cyclobacteriaceae bacterium]